VTRSREDASPLRLGTAYYPEYFGRDRVGGDLDLMRDAGVTVVRVGESVWSTWEPRDGQFDTQWLRPVLDEAHRRGIQAVVGTPTYAVPPWLQVAHPEIAAQDRTGVRVPWGGRQEVDLTSPTFRRYAERVVRRVVGAYADHPAVIGFQVDNEPGAHLLHNPAVFSAFRERLRAEHGSVEALNEAWGLVYWSHRLTGFEELWRPDGNTLPQYDLAWRRFQADLTTEYLRWQVGLVRALARDDQFVTTCLALTRPALDDVAAAGELDVTAVNLYYGMQDHLALGQELDPPAPWITTGVAELLGAADRSYGLAQERFSVTETNAQSIGDSDVNLPPHPGQLRQGALAMVARGAALVEYSHWNTIPFGTETHWGGVLPHSGEPGRTYREVAALGRELARMAPRFHGYRPDHDVTLLRSNASRWALEFQPFLPQVPAQERGGVYELVFRAFHRGVVESGRQAAVLHEEQLTAVPVGELVASHPVLVAVGLYAADDEVLQHLQRYAEAGGHLVLGVRTAFADEQARVRPVRAPAVFAGPAGTWYEEATTLRRPVALTVRGDLAVDGTARATRWAEGLLPDGADVLLTYDDPQLEHFAAVTTRRAGRGRITWVGTVPDPVLAADLVRWLVPAGVGAGWDLTGLPVTLTSGVNAAGDRLWFLHNWSGAGVDVGVPVDLVDAVDDAAVPAGSTAHVDRWGCRVWRQPGAAVLVPSAPGRAAP